MGPPSAVMVLPEASEASEASEARKATVMAVCGRVSVAMAAGSDLAPALAVLDGGLVRRAPKINQTAMSFDSK